VTLGVALIIWFVPPPGTLTLQAWRLFAIFGATILSVMIGAFPILTASILALATAVLTGVRNLTSRTRRSRTRRRPIIIAFLVARAVAKTGLGQRLGHRAISLFGRSTLGLRMRSSRWMR
jgi:DASS family divalent anion:Na+ symporter